MPGVADLGGSSKYSHGRFEDRGGMGFMRTSSGHGLTDH